MGDRRERVLLALAALAPFVLYLITAYRDVTYWDVGEMDTVPWILGIAHPTAFPAYVLAGWLFTHVFVVGSVAFRMSALSALAMSLAAFLIARIVYDAYRSAVAGTAAALLFSAGIIAWSTATRADVHAVATLAFVALLFFALRWYRTDEPRDAYAAAAVFGAGIAVHPVLVTVLPALLVLVIARLHETQTRTLLCASAIAMSSAAVWFVYLPLRSSYVTAHGLDPTLALGLAPGSAFWDYDHPATWSGFVALVTGEQFSVARAFASIGAGEAVEQLGRFLADLVRECTPLGAIAIVVGLLNGARRDLVATLTLALAGGVSALFGLSYPDESDVGRYFLPAFAVAAVFVGAACAVVTERRVRAIASLAIAGCAAWNVFTQPWFFHQPHDVRARAEIDEVRSATADGSVLVATWVLAPPLAYNAYVEHGLGARVVAPAWIGDEADRIGGWLEHRRVYVVGTPQGSIPGYRLERLATRTELYRVVPE